MPPRTINVPDLIRDPGLQSRYRAFRPGPRIKSGALRVLKTAQSLSLRSSSSVRGCTPTSVTHRDSAAGNAHLARASGGLNGNSRNNPRAKGEIGAAIPFRAGSTRTCTINVPDLIRDPGLQSGYRAFRPGPRIKSGALLVLKTVQSFGLRSTASGSVRGVSAGFGSTNGKRLRAFVSTVLGSTAPRT